ncbi:MAG: transcription antitermination factor NusB [bacterium]
MGSRHRARTLALQALYGLELKPPRDVEAELARFLEHFHPDEGLRPFFLSLVRGTLAHLGEIDQALERCSQHWKLERMPAVDRNLLRVAAYEVLHEREVPAEVTISEAVDLAKRFGGAETPSFVNAILDRVAREAGRLPLASGAKPAEAKRP